MFVFLETENVITLELFPKKFRVIARFAEQEFGWDSLAGLAILSRLKGSGFE